MYVNNCNRTQTVINSLIRYAKKYLPESRFKLFSQFISQYYANVAFEDLKQRSLTNLYGAAISHWNLLFQRKPQEYKLRVYNPRQEEHGWQSVHTIVELVCDDQPFLVDSILMEVNRQGLTNHCLINLGGLKVCRNEAHEVVRLLSVHSKSKQAISEAVIYMEIDCQTDPHRLEDLRINFLRVLNDISLSVRDWESMQLKMQKSIDELKALSLPNINRDIIDETRIFLTWLLDCFTFIGYREYKVDTVKEKGKTDTKSLSLMPNQSLGVLSNRNTNKLSRPYSELPAGVRKLALSPEHILIIAKTNTDATLHRKARTDYVGIKRFDKSGNVIGERQFIGLFTSDLYDNDPSRIPILRRKVANLLARAKVSETGYVAKHLLHILKTLPRDDLMQGSEDELFELMMGILHLQERRRIRLFVREDVYGRYFSCLVYVPRDHYDTELRLKIQKILLKEFKGYEAVFSPYLSESVLARIHYIIRIDPKKKLTYDVKSIEKKLKAVARSWQDDLSDSLLKYFGEEKGNVLYNKYQRAFPSGYKEAFLPCAAVFDIEHIEESLISQPNLAMSFYRPIDAGISQIAFKLFGPSVLLSDVLPMLENMGLKVIEEHPYKITFEDESEVWVNNFSMTYCGGDIGPIEKIRDSFQKAFSKIWNGIVENDTFNRLVLSAKLNWRQVSICRAYARYLRQLGFTFSQHYMAMVLNDNPTVVKLLINIFELRFDPDSIDQPQALQDKINELKKQFLTELDKVASLDEDRILRRYLAIVEATVRTNYFQWNSQDNQSDIVFKLIPSYIPEVPLPIPEYECFVYGVRFEGTHLRFGKVARGGIRWSKRIEDYRTEVLGLVKTQNVKNAVIVPFGSKGGFVAKNLPVDASPDVVRQEGVVCYQNFIRGLLSVTDNLVEGKVKKPERVVCYDDDDFYLAVAADSGTATFSKIANTISCETQYWLGDAFASGGLTGYDHKAMGITAKGAWESVKRHFFELGIDIEKQHFTVVGIGDMSGDVFGNGMLLSERIKLVAAFNHMHIFLDPDPDPRVSFQERQRLFNLPYSTWDNYDKTLISKGGGVYSRHLKFISLSPEIKTLLGIRKDKIVPSELIQMILKAKVDLIWNGGIGTYIKSSRESNQDVLDWSNDNLRIDGSEVRAQIIVEGGNLGCTQLGRIEYDLNNGRINTDFIDNVGGVNCSDHEVNIKILLDAVVDAGDITRKQRNQLLVDMTDDVAELVLRNNYRQIVSISLSLRQQSIYFNFYQKYLDREQKQGSIDRTLEFLPDTKTLSDRRTNLNRGLTRPEIAVLLAYSKISLYKDIFESDLPENPFFSKYLESAFPKILKQRYPKAMQSHRLRREIIATQLSNSVIDDMGIIFVYQMQDEIGVPVSSVVSAFIIAREIFDMDLIWGDITGLEGKIKASLQLDLFEELIRLIRRSVRWFLQNRINALDIESSVNAFLPYVRELRQSINHLMTKDEHTSFIKRREALVVAGVPKSVADKVVNVCAMYPALNIIEVASKLQLDVKLVAQVYFILSNKLGLNWLRKKVDCYPIDSNWSMLARSCFKANLDRYLRELVTLVLQLSKTTKTVDDLYNNWFSIRKGRVTAWQAMLAELKCYENVDFTMLCVALLKIYELTLMNE